MSEELDHALKKIEDDEHLRVVIITGAGRRPLFQAVI
jgi:enoyl-CoA hydratase/carnithine racemase